MVVAHFAIAERETFILHLGLSLDQGCLGAVELLLVPRLHVLHLITKCLGGMGNSAYQTQGFTMLRTGCSSLHGAPYGVMQGARTLVTSCSARSCRLRASTSPLRGLRAVTLSCREVTSWAREAFSRPSRTTAPKTCEQRWWRMNRCAVRGEGVAGRQPHLLQLPGCTLIHGHHVHGTLL